jgi:hypothetical protein
MNQPAKTPEPSMEEILASIRRIIADDDAPKPEKAADAPKPAAPRIVESSPPPSVAALAAGALPEKPADALRGPNANASGEQTVEDVFQLTESMATAGHETPPVFRTVDSAPDVFFSEEDIAATPQMSEPQQFTQPPEPSAAYEPQASGLFSDLTERSLISDATSSAVNSAFNSLAQTILVQNSRTLEDLVREMLRPMLKGWLDDNLPGLVERIVRAEIERVSRGK